MDFNLFEYYNRSKNSNILISFKGALSQEILIEMGALIKHKMNIDKKIKKIFSVFVEMSQNIMRYSGEKETVGGKETGVGMILFTESPEFYHVFSGNVVLNKDVDAFIEKIDHINSLDANELKDLYMDKIRSAPDSESKGAGLGLIEIARKSKSPIKYIVNVVNDTKSFVELSVQIFKD